MLTGPSLRWDDIEIRKTGFERALLKKNLDLYHKDGWVLNAEEAKALGLHGLEDVGLGEQGPSTHIGILHEEGHAEPWYIAMDASPSKATTLDYGMRWGIEALFSDVKTRGFAVSQTQLRTTDRIERLLLVLTIALYWAVSTGMAASPPPTGLPLKKALRSWTSFFKHGLRCILQAILSLRPLPPFCQVVRLQGAPSMLLLEIHIYLIELLVYQNNEL